MITVRVTGELKTIDLIMTTSLADWFSIHRQPIAEAHRQMIIKWMPAEDQDTYEVREFT